MDHSRAAIRLDASHRLFLFLAGLFITSLLVGDMIGGKLFEIEAGWFTVTISVGMIPFPIVFLLTDLINEFYGRRAARTVTFTGFAMAIFTIVVLATATLVPWAPFTREPGWQGVTQASFDNIFSSSQRILISSTVAYLFAQLIDISVFHFLKRATSGRYLWLRATGSTVVSQLIDTCVIQLLAWYGLMPLMKIASTIVSSYGVKLVAAILMTPVIYAAHAMVERWLGLDALPAADPEV